MLILLFHLFLREFIGVHGADFGFLVIMNVRLGFNSVVRCSVIAFFRIIFGFIRLQFWLVMIFKLFWPIPHSFE